MVNFGFGLATYMGVALAVTAIIYLASFRTQRRTSARSSNAIQRIGVIGLVCLRFACLLVSSVILIIQGWRLDPILLFGYGLTVLLSLEFLFREVRRMRASASSSNASQRTRGIGLVGLRLTCLFVSFTIFKFQGWRLDPILQAGYGLMILLSLEFFFQELRRRG